MTSGADEASENASPPQQPIRIEQPHILCGEGKDEANFLEALGKHMSLDRFQVLDYGGKSQLRQWLGQFKKAPRFREVVSLVVSRDADQDWSAAFQSAQDALTSAGLERPQKPMVWADGPPRVAILVLPAPHETGDLETLCLRALDEHPAMPCVHELLACFDAAGYEVRENRRSKAAVHAFLASTRYPDLRLGEAALRGCIPFDHDAFAEPRRLLSEPTS